VASSTVGTGCSPWELGYRGGRCPPHTAHDTHTASQGRLSKGSGVVGLGVVRLRGAGLVRELDAHATTASCSVQASATHSTGIVSRMGQALGESVTLCATSLLAFGLGDRTFRSEVASRNVSLLLRSALPHSEARPVGPHKTTYAGRRHGDRMLVLLRSIGELMPNRHIAPPSQRPHQIAFTNPPAPLGQLCRMRSRMRRCT